MVFGTLKLAVLQEWIDEISWFLYADTNLAKLKVSLIIIRGAWSKIGKGFTCLKLTIETLEQGVKYEQS